MPDGAGPDIGAALATARPSRRAGGVTLGRRIVTLVAVVALPLLALAAWSVWTSQASIRDAAERGLTQRAQSIMLALEREFDRGEALLQVLAGSSVLARGKLDLVEDEMRAASAVFGGLPVTLVTGDGRILLNTRWAHRERRAPPLASEETRRVVAEGRVQVTNLFKAATTGVLAMSVAVPIPGLPQVSEAGVQAAFFALTFPRDHFATLLRRAADLGEADLDAGWTASVIDRSGVSVARTAAEAGVVGSPARPEVFARLAAAEDRVLHGLTTREGVPIITTTLRGTRSGYLYVLTMPRVAFTAPLREALAQMAAIGALVLSLGIGLAAILARRIVAAFHAVPAAAVRDPPGGTGLREADELATALAETRTERDRTAAALAESERANREVLESLGERLFALDADGRVRFASRTTMAVWGVTPPDLLGRTVEEVLPMAAGSTAWEAVLGVLKSRAETHLCAISALSHRWVEVDAYPTADGGVTVAFRDIEELKRAQGDSRRTAAALRAAEERQRLALEAAELGAWEVDRISGTIRRSDRVLEVFGLGHEAAEEPYPARRDRIHPKERDATLRAVEQAITGKTEGFRVEYRFRRDDGTWVWVESHGRVVARHPVTGAALRMVGAARDVSARRAAEERQSLLAREVDHRAKNALAVVQAAVRLTPKDDAAAFARAIEGRVGALARAHTLLAADSWVAADLRTLLEGELAPFLGDGDTDPRAMLEGPRVALPAGAAQPIAMAVHELATNALKYGGLSAPGGRVEVAWSVEAGEGGAPQRLRLRWTERGGPPVAGPPARRGFGSRVLEGTVRSQLRGDVSLAWDRAGLRCEIAVPLRPPPEPGAGD